MRNLYENSILRACVCFGVNRREGGGYCRVENSF